MIPPTIVIEGVTLSDTWAKLVKATMQYGIDISSEYGPMTKDICSIATIKYPYEDMILHPQFPTKEQHLREYIKQFDRDYDWKKQNFKYTYMDRFIHYPISNPSEDIPDTIDQFITLKAALSKPITRRAQMITWVPAIDAIDEEPPCMQYMTFRKLSSDTIELHCHWRSRDIFAGWLSNYIAILTMLKREIFIPLNLKLVKLVDFIDYAHIYKGNWEEASKVMPAVVNPMLMR